MERTPLQLAYEQTAVGYALMDTLQQFVDEEKITDANARSCMKIFYAAIASRIKEFNQIPDKIVMRFDVRIFFAICIVYITYTIYAIQGDLNMYRFCNNIWTLHCNTLRIDYVSPQSKVSKEGKDLAIVALERKSHLR